MYETVGSECVNQRVHGNVMIIKFNQRGKNSCCGRSRFLCIVDFTKINKISVRGYYDAATFNSRCYH